MCIRIHFHLILTFNKRSLRVIIQKNMALRYAKTLYDS